MSNLKYWLWLTSRVGVSGQGMAELLSHFGTPESAYFADRHAYESVAGVKRPAVLSRTSLCPGWIRSWVTVTVWASAS